MMYFSYTKHDQHDSVRLEYFIRHKHPKGKGGEKKKKSLIFIIRFYVSLPIFILSGLVPISFYGFRFRLRTFSNIGKRNKTSRRAKFNLSPSSIQKGGGGQDKATQI